MKVFKSTSLLILILTTLFIFSYRITRVDSKEISWDVLGYYLPLPATFIYDDYMLDNPEWLKKVNDRLQLTGTLYMVSSNDEGEPMYFFLLGMSLFYLPFFLFGHLFSWLLNYQMDGFSLPYHYALVVGGIFYTIVGLVFLRKNLRHYFSEKVAATVILILVFATNYVHHLTLKNLETVTILFMLVNIIIWYTIKWHQKARLGYMVAVGAGIVLTGLVKPSEVLVIIIPLLWNVNSKSSLKAKFELLFKYRGQIIVTVLIGLILALPQLAYWLAKTGSLVYDSYKNPGVGLDVFKPHILESLFSYRKGWLLYTPVMIYSLAGFIFLFKKNNKQFFAYFIYFVASFYLISSWSEWWYGAGFSNRPLISVYPVLAISLGYFIQWIFERRVYLIGSFVVSVLIFAFLNQFQWWQLKHYILDPYRTTKDYYWETFLKTNVPEQTKELLLIKRSFFGKMDFLDRSNYLANEWVDQNFNNAKGDNILVGSDGNRFLRIRPEDVFTCNGRTEYSQHTQLDHMWIVATIDVKFNVANNAGWPNFVMAIDRKNGQYGYQAMEIAPDSLNSGWQTYEFTYLTPEMRDMDDDIVFYIWNKGQADFCVDNFKVKLFEKIDPKKTRELDF